MIFIDALQVKIRDGQVANRPIYVVLAVNVDGERDILGLWAGDGGEGAKFWLHVLTELRNRGVADVYIAVCDGLKGLPEAIGTVWPQAVVQNCIVHLLRNSFRYASRRDWTTIARDLKPDYTAPTEAAALDRLAEFAASGRTVTRRSCGCGRTPGPSSCRSCPSTPRSAPSSPPPMPSSPSTPGSVGRSEPADTSPPSRPR